MSFSLWEPQECFRVIFEAPFFFKGLIFYKRLPSRMPRREQVYESYSSGRIKHARNRGYRFVWPSPPLALRGKKPFSSTGNPPVPKGPKIEKFQSRLKFSIPLEMKISISLEIFNPDLQNSPQKIGVWWAARLKFSISLENFKILIFFNLWALRGTGNPLFLW